MNEIQKAALYPLRWDEINKDFTEVLVASPADEHGRGIKLEMTIDGEEPYLYGARIYLLWQHRVTRAQGCEPFQRQMGDSEYWYVYYPTVMTLARGTVDVQIMIEMDDESTISSKTFLVRVERVLIDGTTEGDGFDLFRDAIRKYEDGSELAHDAADAATAAAERANAAAERAETVTGTSSQVIEDAKTAASDAHSAAASAESAAAAATSATEEATTQAAYAKRMGEAAANNALAAAQAGQSAESVAQHASSVADRAEAAIESLGSAAEDARTAAAEVREAAERGDFNGADGTDGKDGISCTHRWDGTTLTVTSASGTSSADLKGEPGAPGQSPTIVVLEPLRYENDELSIDLTDLCVLEY